MLQFCVLTNWKKFVTAIGLVLHKQPILFEKSDFCQFVKKKFFATVFFRKNKQKLYKLMKMEELS